MKILSRFAPLLRIAPAVFAVLVVPLMYYR